MKIFLGIFWAIFLVALVSMLRGNPTAVNAVIGIGFPALILTLVEVLDRT